MNVESDFLEMITLYPTDGGGKKLTMQGDFYSCCCKFDPADAPAWDARILLGGASLAPGETKQFGFKFLTPEAGALFRGQLKFYLWEGRIIGEVVPMR